MSKEVKVALITGAATIVAAIITGIFLIHSNASSQSNVSSTPPLNSSTSQPSFSSDITPTPVVTVNSSGSTPSDTLTKYCTALKTDNAQMIYDTESTTYKSALDLPLIQQIITLDDAQGGVKQCTFDYVQLNGSTATANIYKSYGDGASNKDGAYLVLENNIWKIGNLNLNS